MAFDVITPTKFGQAAITTGVTTLYTVPASTPASGDQPALRTNQPVM